MTKVLYPGSFDPITLGHMNIIEQASFLFDEVLIAIMKNPNKSNHFFTIEERYEIVKEIYAYLDNINVIMGEGASVDVALENNCKAIVRGIRSGKDYSYEVEMNQMNLDISNGRIRTVPLFADREYQFLSSSMVKEVDGLDKDISNYVHPLVKQKMLEKKLR
jgi:pantetheine-phosphate adenylyltransferase